MKLPRDLSGRRIVRALGRLGFLPHHQKGSHLVLKHADGRRAVVPMHAAVDTGTLSALLGGAEVAIPEFLRQL